MHYIILSNSDYGTLCFAAGLGWGLFITTFVAALTIDNIKWYKRINQPIILGSRS